MAITVNGAVLRNMPEQISKNVEDIADHEDRLSTIEGGIAGDLALNNVTVSGDATINDLTVIGDTVLGNDASDTLNITGAVDIAGSTEITGATTINGNTNVNGNFDVSGTANIGMLTFTDANIAGSMVVGGDFSVAGTANIGTFTFTNANIAGNMAVSGDLAVTGAITGASITEDMSGYAFDKETIANATYTMLYAGIVKNGNKLTMSAYFKITPSANLSASQYMFYFELPSSIYNLIQSTTIESDDSVVDVFNYNAKSTVYGVGITAGAYAYKAPGNTRIYFAMDLSSLATSTTYVVRIERTYLLSNSLA